MMHKEEKYMAQSTKKKYETCNMKSCRQERENKNLKNENFSIKKA